MNNKKLPTDLSVEELLAALNQEEATQLQQEQNPNLIPMPEYTGQLPDSMPIYSFIEAFRLKPGPHNVSSQILFKLYKMWNKKDGRNHGSFTMELCKYIPKIHTQANKQDIFYFKVNERGAKLAYYVDQYYKFNKRKYFTVKDYRKHYEKFFEDIQLKQGPIFVEADVLYHVYDTYMYKNKRKSHPYTRFELICKLFFECKFFDGTATPWFGVSENIKQLISPEAVANWREGRKRFHENKRRKPIKEEDKKEILYPEKE